MARIDEDAYSKFQLIYCWGDSHGNRAAGNTSTLMNLSQTRRSTTGNPVFSYLCSENTLASEVAGVLRAGARPLLLSLFAVRAVLNIGLDGAEAPGPVIGCGVD